MHVRTARRAGRAAHPLHQHGEDNMELKRITLAIAAMSLAAAAGAQGMSNPASTQSSDNPASSYSSQDRQGSSATSSNADNSQVRQAQQALKDKGYDVGAVDGQMGPHTQSALNQFQQAQGLPQSGDLDTQTLAALGVSEAGSAATPSSGATPSGSAMDQRSSASGTTTGAASPTATPTTKAQ
jgi:peptidoglycan hydrolase-like protein with peptidoglycan-binding domain